MLKTVANRTLHWMAAIGLFLMCDAVGVQQFMADSMQRISWEINQKK